MAGIARAGRPARRMRPSACGASGSARSRIAGGDAGGAPCRSRRNRSDSRRHPVRHRLPAWHGFPGTGRDQRHRCAIHDLRGTDPEIARQRPRAHVGSRADAAASAPDACNPEAGASSSRPSIAPGCSGWSCCNSIACVIFGSPGANAVPVDAACIGRIHASERDIRRFSSIGVRANGLASNRSGNTTNAKHRTAAATGTLAWHSTGRDAARRAGSRGRADAVGRDPACGCRHCWRRPLALASER